MNDQETQTAAGPECSWKCISVCPNCWRHCSLNQGHYSDHQCEEGHKW